MSVETPPERLPHLPSVQVLRGFATLGVLLAHLYAVEGKYSPDRLLGRWSDLGHWGVDIFFVISGFIMVYVTWNAPRGHGQVPLYLWRRATRIYPLYWAISLVILVLWLIRPDMVFGSNPDPDILRSFLLYPQSGSPLLAVGWTLVHEVYFYLVFALILLVSRRWVLPFLALWSAIAVAGWFWAEPRIPTFQLVFSPLTLEFTAGAAFGCWYAGATPEARRQPLLSAACFAMAAVLVMVVGFTQDDLIAYAADYALRVPLYGSAALFAFAGLLLSGWQVGRVAEWLGDISYSLYLTHVMALTVVAQIAKRFLGSGYVDNVILIMSMTATALVAGHLTYRFVEKPLIDLFRRRRRPAPARDGVPASG